MYFNNKPEDFFSFYGSEEIVAGKQCHGGGGRCEACGNCGNCITICA
jgi:hypothetical protein